MSSLYQLHAPESLLSPSLIIFRDLVRRNLQEMIRMAGGVERLRPHAKTHKMAGVIQMGRELGVVKHKCATIAEAEMIARAGGTTFCLPILWSALTSGGSYAWFSNIPRQCLRGGRRGRTDRSAGPGGPGPRSSDPDARRPGGRHGAHRRQS